jgi:hypothetical protein
VSDTQTLTNGKATDFQSKTKRQRRQPPPLPTVASASDMASVTYEGKVDTTPCSWDALPLGSSFSLSPDGSYLKVKTSKTQFRDCRNGQAMTVGSGRCYRVFF